MKKILLNNNTKNLNLAYINPIYKFLELIEDEYPNFRNWYFNNVFKNNSLIDRKVIVYKLYDEICGVSILKLSEQKVCTLRISEKFHGNKIGTLLMQESLIELNTTKPLITVSEDRFHQFYSIFSSFDFQLNSVHENYYNKGKREFVYNRNLIGDFNSNQLVNENTKFTSKLNMDLVF